MKNFLKNKSNIILLCLLTSLAFAYTCSTPTSSGDDGKPCSEDPFGSNCGAEFLQARVTHCITAGNASETRCEAIFTGDSTSANTCLTNPFADACKTNTAFTRYADTARTNRLEFCNTNTGDALCTGANVANICGFDPFSTNCFTGTTYDTPRQMKCLADDMADDSCRGSSGIINTFCTANPFDTSNACMANTYQPLRQMRQTQCVADSSTHTNCATVLGSIVDPTDITGITTPTGVLNHADLPATVTSAIADTNILSHFLSVGADGVLDTTGFSATSTTLSRAGDVMDGVTYVTGLIESATQGFVGLLPSTNLGVPLMEAPTDTTWEGSYYLGQINRTHDIIFTINFGMKKITGEDTQGVSGTTFTLGFTATGVITGDVDLSLTDNTPDTAQVRGLIGEQGLVGGFANTDGGARGGDLFGGFVADAP